MQNINFASFRTFLKKVISVKPGTVKCLQQIRTMTISKGGTILQVRCHSMRHSYHQGEHHKLFLHLFSSLNSIG